MEEWKTYKLHEIGTIVGGATPLTSCADYYGGDIGWITPKDLSTLHGRYILNGERNITKQGLESCSTQILPKDSVLFSSRSPIGYVAIAQTALCTNQGFKSIIPNCSKVNPMFLYYLLVYNKDKIEGMGSGTTFKEVSASVMRQVEVSIPSLSRQRKIAEILDSLDSKIELNRRINDNLEQQAQALYKSWFVDFEPFKDGKFVDSELGLIPEGWRVGTISEFLNSTVSGDWGKEIQQGNYTAQVLCIRGADIPEVRKGDAGKMPTRYIQRKNLDTKKLDDGDLIVELSGGTPTQSTGRACRVSRSILDRFGGAVICTNFCKALKPKKEFSYYLFFLWDFLYSGDVMFSYENGTTGIKNLDINGLIQKEPVIVPNKEVLSLFSTTVDSLFENIQSNGCQTEKLANLRDAILPKLMSGELKPDQINL